MSDQIYALQSEYCTAVQKAREDRMANGAYTRAGFEQMARAAQLQKALAAAVGGEDGERHMAMFRELAQQAVIIGRSLGLNGEDAAEAPSAQVQTAEAAQEAQEAPQPRQGTPAEKPAIPAKKPWEKPQAAQKDKKDDGELDGFDVNAYVIHPGEVTVEDVIDSQPAVMRQLMNALYDDTCEKFPNLQVEFVAGVPHMMMFGPPGCGKTMACKAMATYLHEKYPSSAVFYNIPADQIKSKFVSTAGHRLRAIFEEAAKYEHAVICIDEVDKLCPKEVGRDQINYTAPLLELIDGVKGKTKAVIILATNFPDNVNTALVNRIGNRVFIDFPGAKDIARVLKGKPAISRGLGSDAVDALAEEAARRRFSYRNVNVLVSRLQQAMKEALLKRYPDGTDEAITHIPMTCEECLAVLKEVSTDYDAREYAIYHRYLEARNG